jgi:hypothetical protein
MGDTRGSEPYQLASFLNMKTLEQRILQVLENHDGFRLDNETERGILTDALVEMFGDWLDQRELGL